MKELQNNPVSAVRKIFGSKKILFLCIVMTVAVAASLIQAFDSAPNLTEVSLFGMQIRVSDLFGSEIAEMLDAVSDVILVFSVILLLPEILTAGALWMIKFGERDGQRNTKNTLLALNFFKINFFCKLLSQVMSMIGVAIAAIAVILLGMELGSTGAGFLVTLVLLAIVFLVFFFISKYYANYISMLVGVSNTLRTGLNQIIVSRQVIVLNYIIAGWLILSSFGDGFMGFVAGAAEALCLICINLCFSDFDALCGYVTLSESKELAERIKTDPALAEAARALGVDRESAGKAVFSQIFGLGISADVEETPVKAAPAAPSAFAETQGWQTPRNNRPQSSASAPVAMREVEARTLSLFGGDMEQLDSRFSLLGKRSIRKRTDCPVDVVGAAVVQDAVSEKKILRMEFFNNAPCAIREVKLEIVSKNNRGQAIAVSRSASVRLEAAAPSGMTFGATHGVVLPDDMTNGTARVVYVEFDDGLYWDKLGEEVAFVTDEKVEYDTALYLAAMNV